MRWDFRLGAVVRGQDDNRVLELTGFLQGGDQPAEYIVNFDHAIAEDRTGRRLAGVLLVGIVVEVAAARAVIEEPRRFRVGHLVDEFLAVLFQEGRLR